MAMVKPTALTVNAFDATQSHIFYFTSTGGNQVVKNKITIRDNTTNDVVYTNTVESFLFQQEVPADTLINGTYYNYFFNTYDISDNESPNSNVVAFYCYTQPTVVFTNAPTTNIVEGSSYTFDITYDQTEGELLDYLVYRLYNASGVELPPSSGNLYSSLTPPLTFSHTFDGFLDNTAYKIQVEAVSVNGTVTYSELYEFTASYIQPNVVSLLTLENKCDEGYVQITSNIILAEGTVDPEPALFMSDVVVEETPISNIQMHTLLINPYFSDGTTSWSVTNGGISDSLNVLTLLATATDGYVYQSNTALASHVIYISSYIKSTTASVSLVLNDGVTTSSIAHSGSGNYERLSLIHTEDVSATNTIFEVHDYRTSTWDNVYIRDCICIDLTYVYGAGNEPTKTVMDNIISQSFECISWDVWYEPVDDVIGVWADRYAIDLKNPSQTLTFNDGFSIPSNFQLQMWMRYHEDGIIYELYKTGNESNKLIFEIKRGVPYGETTDKTWIIVYTEDGNLYEYSNYVDIINPLSDLIIWFKKVDNTYTVFLDVIRRSPSNYIEINVSSNVQYGMATDISYIGENIPQSEEIKVHNDISSLFPMDNLIIMNGEYDNMDITSNTDRVYSRSFPIWDYYTKINCDFSSLNAGNIDLVLSQIESMKIKRRLNGTFDWITLYTIPVSSASDLNILRGDCGVPTSKMFDYAIVPVLSGGVEGDYIIQSINTSFRWCYLCDGDTIIKFYSNLTSSITSNPIAGVLVPIGRRTPITIYNSENDYESGTFGGNVLGTNFLTTRQLSRSEVQSQLTTYKSFINNKRPKFLKDWDGRIRIVDTNTTSGLLETPDLINGKANLSFSWVEKGSYNNQNDLYYNGLVDGLS